MSHRSIVRFARRRLSIRVVLLLIVVVSLLPLLAGLAYSVVAARDSSQSNAKAGSVELAHLAASGVAQFIEDSHVLMGRVAQRDVLAALHGGRCDPILAEIPRLHPEYANIGVVDLRGRVFCSAVAVHGHPSVARTDWFRHTASVNRFTVNDMYLGTITHRWVSVLALPLRARGRTEGYLALPIDLVRYQAPFQSLGLDAGSVVGIYDDRHRVVARSQGSERWVGQLVPDVRAGAGARDGSEATSRGQDGRARLVGFARVPGTDWTAYAGVSRARALEATNELTVAVSSVAGVSLLIAVLLALLTSRAIVRPVRRLVDTARLVEFGDRDARVAVGGPRELAVAGAQFNTMVATCATAEREQRELAQRLMHSQKLEVIGQLAGGIAHDFNNLLTAIRGYASLALTRSRPGELHSDLTEITRAADLAASVTGQLLAFSRREQIELGELNIAETVTDSSALLERLLGSDISLDLAIDQGVFAVAADRTQIQQVLLNLAVNARQAMPGGGVVSITLANRLLSTPLVRGSRSLPAGRYVELAVIDSGPGIAAADIDSIFDAFFTTKPAGQGTGLGLSTVSSIIQASDGVVWYEPGATGGAGFRILLPAIETASMPAPTRHGPTGRLNAEVVLVMEDEPIVRGVVRVMLEEAGCSVLAPTSVREGLKLLQDPTNLPDVLVTDCVMPGVRSGEFARRARTLRPDLPIVTMSGNLALRNPSSVAAIADAFLQKPFTRDELVAAVSLALEARVGAHRRLGAD